MEGLGFWVEGLGTIPELDSGFGGLGFKGLFSVSGFRILGSTVPGFRAPGFRGRFRAGLGV